MRLLTVRTMWRVLNRFMPICPAKETCRAERMSLICQHSLTGKAGPHDSIAAGLVAGSNPAVGESWVAPTGESPAQAKRDRST